MSEGLLEKSCLAPEDSMKILNANNKYISEEVLSLKDFMWSNRSVHVSKTVLHAKYIWMTEHDGLSCEQFAYPVISSVCSSYRREKCCILLSFCP